GLMIKPKHSKIEAANLNVVSSRIFLRLFDYAYRDMLFRKNEKALVFSLNQRILQLNSLIDTGIEIAKLHHNESPHHLALTRAASITNAARGIVRVQSGNTTIEEFTFPAGIEIDLSFDNACRITSTFAFMEKSFLFELFDKESRSGIVPFEETDQLLLDALAKQVHASMENRYLLDQALEKQRIEQEITVAASIQQRILPVALPALPGYDIAGVNIPSKSVGGDYYDCIPLRNGMFAIIVADVTGKGVPAALLVSSLHAYLRAYLEESFSLPELAARLNKSLYRDSTEDKFVTAFIGIIDPAKGEIECLSAGHNPAYILRRSGHVDELNVGGPPLGIIDLELPYQSARMTLGKGERILLYTDGVTEALNEKNELFEDYYSLPKYLALHAGDDAETFISRLIADIKKFSASEPQSDDITIIYLRRL
ncbi:MAG TPA: PP2C family protein-serine/threonine phosphatase, partial [Bacteroidota bacterium]|nr:PP2C family protein-serine/threonine phosphatase [Bacteroidota bacterium]